MEFNRNHYFLAGLVVLFLGIQMRMVDSFILSSESTRFLASRFPNAKGATIANMAPAEFRRAHAKHCVRQNGSGGP